MRGKLFDAHAPVEFEDGRRYEPYHICLRDTETGCCLLDWTVLDCRNCGTWRFRLRFWPGAGVAYSDALQRIILIHARRIVYRYLFENRQCPGISSDIVEADVCLGSES